MKKTVGSENTLNRIFSLLKRNIALATLSLLLAAAGVALSLYIPVAVGSCVDAIAGENEVDFENLFRLFVNIAVCAGGGALIQWAQGMINNRVVYHTVRDLRAKAIRKLQKTPLSYLDPRPAGDTVSRMVSDAETFADGLLLGFSQLFTGAATIIGTLIFMFGLNVKITLIVAFLTPATLFAARFIAKRTYKTFRLQSLLRGEATAFIDESVSNQKTVKAFGREEANTARFADINRRLSAAALKATFFSSLTNPTTRFLNALIYAAAALAGSLMIIGGEGALTVGGLSAFLSFAAQYAKPFNEISGVITELQNSIACGERVFELIYDSPCETDPEGCSELRGAKGDINIEDLDFSYDKAKTLIKRLRLDVKKGEKIAIVGPTGCGKTTLINLLMRFYDADGGRIYFDGQDAAGLTRGSVRRNFGMVLQDTWIKEDTVRANIAFGRPDASEEEIVAAAKAAHADGFISRLPQGYNTVISDSGGLSQGEKQLICIARVMLCLPPMLILDEATSSIDTRTELKIQDAFAGMMRGRTSFIVAHRLSTVRDADKILMMKNGEVVEQGRHAELLAKNGEYAALYNSQFES